MKKDITIDFKKDFCNHYEDNCRKCPYGLKEDDSIWCRVLGKYVLKNISKMVF